MCLHAGYPDRIEYSQTNKQAMATLVTQAVHKARPGSKVKRVFGAELTM
jgi:hypothetical protein